MKRTSICGVKIDTDRTFWTNGRTNGLLRQNERMLYAKIDLLQSYCDITEKEEDLVAYYTDMDFYFILVKLIDKFGYSNDMLELSFFEAYTFLENGDFYDTSLSDGERNAYFQSLLSQIISATENNNKIAETIDVYYSTLFADLVKTNYYINPITDAVSVKPFAESGIMGDEDWCAKLKTQGPYFNYSQASGNLFYNQKKATAKRIAQKNLKERLTAINPTFRNGVADDLIDSGIVSGFRMTADESVITIRTGGSVKIGDPATVVAVLGLIATIASAIGSVWVSYLDMKKAEVSKDTANALNNAKYNGAAAGDWFGIDENNDGTISSSEKFGFIKKIAIFGGIIIVAYNLLT